ncbi:hypothetical protein [Novosphingobium sp. Chol11]|uniref:hypothetical protein n=1 Tax=Novosphingobium sp. Chol11 TaxID=1385763 RepID=UPI00114112BF|nr:hypothetical protein [Novosphingobium sp. Chol11]
MHTSMFSMGHTRDEVRDALKQHYKRDNGRLGFYDLVTGACALFLVRKMEIVDAAAVLIGLGAAITAIRHFIDQSNRNFYLHRLDWEEAAEVDRPSRHPNDGTGW